MLFRSHYVFRAGLGVLIPAEGGVFLLIDGGANIDPSPKHIVGFAVMGSVYYKAVVGGNQARVGLLNIGTEDVKGHEAVKTASAIRQKSDLPIKFYGFVEGDDIGAGTVDVIATDGFPGNVALKTAEGTAKLVAHFLRTALTHSLLGRIGAVLASGALRAVRNKLDPRASNGGVFLGVNGLVVKSHGGADEKGVANAVHVAARLVEEGLSARIGEDLARVGPIASEELIAK